MKDKRVKVRTRPRTLSGYRGNIELTLDADEAARFIERRWADPVEETEREEPRGKRTARL